MKFKKCTCAEHRQFFLKNESSVPVLAPWERCLFGAGPDWPLVFDFPREDWVPAAPALRGLGEVLEEDEEVMDGAPEDEESDCWRSRAK